MNNKWPTRRSLGTAIVICMMAVAVPLLSQSQALPVDIPFVDGIAWLSNDSRDELVRVNGQTGRVDAALSLDGVENASVTQAEGIVLVEVDGEIRRIDLASLEWGESISAEGELVVGNDQSGNPHVYLLMPDGQVRVLDPMTLETQDTIQLDGAPGAGVVVDGRLVATVRTASATSVQVVEDSQVIGAAEVANLGDHIDLSRIGDAVTVVNHTADELTVMDPAGDSVEAEVVGNLELPAGDIVVPTELQEGQLWLLALREGELLGVDLSDGRITTRAQVANERANLAGPVVLNGMAYLVNRDSGTVIQVDAGGDDVGEVTERSLSDFGMDDASQAEVSAVSGKVFVNDPSGNMAVVFSDDGSAEGVDKFTGPEPVDDATDEAETGADDGGQDRRPDRSSDRDSEGQDDQPAERPTEQPAPPPSPPVTPTTQPPVTLPPVTLPTTPPSPPTTAQPTSTTTSVTTTTTTAPPTTTTTLPPTTPPPTTLPQPPGQVTLNASTGDGTVGLSWTVATSRTPVTYHLSSDRPIGGQTAWQTTDLSYSLTGLTNGVPYQLTVTPSNAAGNGPSSQQSVTTAGAPTVSNVSASASGRSITVSFSYSGNGGSLQRCEVSGAGTSATASCDGGTGSATLSVPNHYTNYTFTVTVQTSVGQTTGQATTRSGTKPVTVDGSESRWGGSCYWDEHGTSRPVLAEPVDTCIDEGPDYYVRMTANGSTQQVQCWQRGATIRDNQFVESNVWLRLSDGWMSQLYFTNWEAADDNLPQC